MKYAAHELHHNKRPSTVTKQYKTMQTAAGKTEYDLQ